MEYLEEILKVHWYNVMFSAIFPKGDNCHNCLFTSLCDDVLTKLGLLFEFARGAYCLSKSWTSL